MTSLRTSLPIRVIRPAATEGFSRVVPGDVPGRLGADQYATSACAGRPSFAASTIPEVRTTSGTETLPSLLCLLSQDEDESLAEGTLDLYALSAIPAFADAPSHAA